MSIGVLRVIPSDPDFVPDPARCEEAEGLARSWFPAAVEVSATVSEGIGFVDQGENWERVSCPACGVGLDDWWSGAMDAAWQGDCFRSLAVRVPCCGAETSLNELAYVWPAGFARFVLEVRGLERDLAEEELRTLGEVLGCPMRLVWALY